MAVPQGKNKALIAYATLIGLFIAISMNSDKKDAFATSHIQNMFGLTILWIVSQVVTAYVNTYLGDGLWFLSFILVIISFISAYQNKLPNIPLLSRNFEKWFTFLN